MQNWFQKLGISQKERINNNIDRLNNLKKVLHELGYFVFASQSGGYFVLKSLLDSQLVRGRPKVWEKLNSAYIGENNQKIALDSPNSFQRIVIEAEELVGIEINKEIKNLRSLDDDKRQQ